MVKIREIEETKAILLKDGQPVGEFNTTAQLYDIRIQIKNSKLGVGYSIKWEGEEIFIDEFGNISDWPNGFFTLIDDQLDELLDL